MNDRFKFRAWWKPNYRKPIMLYDVEKTYDFMRGKPESICADCFGEVLEDEDYIVMQCTGKKDKNGTLIYEGDIVRLKAKNGMNFDYVVKYKNYCFILEYINGKLKGTKARDFAKQYAQPQRMYEHGYMVIGNIYENKELLESEG